MSINGRKSFYILTIQKVFFGCMTCFMFIAISLVKHQMHVSHFTGVTL